ncbi:hypothetical protein K7N18_22075 [Burkholderia arboris]|nr:hypothetical protein [Burkholderia arboris]
MQKKARIARIRAYRILLLLPRCAHGNGCDSPYAAQFPKAGIFFGEFLKLAGLRMTRHVGRLRADARPRVAGDVAAQVAARHGLPAGGVRGRRLAKGVPVFLLAMGRLRAIVGVGRGGQRHGNDNAACNEQ